VCVCTVRAAVLPGALGPPAGAIVTETGTATETAIGTTSVEDKRARVRSAVLAECAQLNVACTQSNVACAQLNLACTQLNVACMQLNVHAKFNCMHAKFNSTHASFGCMHAISTAYTRLHTHTHTL